MKQKISHGPLVRFCLFPLLFTMDLSYQGVVIGIGVLILYPFLFMIIEGVKHYIDTTSAFYLTSFIGVLFGSLYILSIGMIDWRLYRELAFTFPASMTASAILIGLLQDHDNNKESTPFIEAFILSFLIVCFTCIRDYILHSSLDFRFGKFGELYQFSRVFEFHKNGALLSTINLRGIMFFVIAFLISLMGISSTDNQENK